MLKTINRRIFVLLTLVTVPLLAGSNCAFFFGSGGGSDDDDRSGLVVAVSNGQLVDAPVEGVSYHSGDISGTTGSNGEFQYKVGNAICFYIGDITLGCAIEGKSLVTPMDLVENGTTDTPAVINIARLLQSLDAHQGEERISIPEAVRLAATHSNEDVSAAIEFLDYADDPAFANAASQLVAALTHSYGFTAVLVDADTAREHMLKSIARYQDP